MFLSNNKLRPVISIGISNKIVFNKNVTVNRKKNGNDFSQQTRILNLSPDIIGLSIGISGTYIVNWKSYINAGINFEKYNSVDIEDFFQRLYGIKTYISYSF